MWWIAKVPQQGVVMAKKTEVLEELCDYRIPEHRSLSSGGCVRTIRVC